MSFIKKIAKKAGVGSLKPVVQLAKKANPVRGYVKVTQALNKPKKQARRK